MVTKVFADIEGFVIFHVLFIQSSLANLVLIRGLFIYDYMPYEGDDDMTNDFTDQLLIVGDLINTYSEYYVIFGGDFNVDFSSDRLHTALLNSFCFNLGLDAVRHHDRSIIDYTYNFNMYRLNILDHFLLSDTIFENLVERAYVTHDADNFSDHDPITVELLLDFNYASFAERAHVSRIS
jgi:hypothetical protein